MSLAHWALYFLMTPQERGDFKAWRAQSKCSRELSGWEAFKRKHIIADIPDDLDKLDRELEERGE